VIRLGIWKTLLLRDANRSGPAIAIPNCSVLLRRVLGDNRDCVGDVWNFGVRGSGGRRREMLEVGMGSNRSKRGER
jgi:hypothetical protein